jgi:hypothetical protein
MCQFDDALRVGTGFMAELDEVGGWRADGWVGDAVLAGFDVAREAALEAGVGVDLDYEIVPVVKLLQRPVPGELFTGLECVGGLVAGVDVKNA